MNRFFEGSKHAIKYKTFRPAYPKLLYDTLFKYLGQECKFKKAVDVACGTGQSTRPLANQFERVIGIDISPAQVRQTNIEKDPDSEGGDHKREGSTYNPEYLQGPAEDLSFLQDNSVDLITCAQAYHWLDRKRFLKEARRVLVHNGTMAVYGYGNLFLNHRKLDSIIEKYYKETLAGYWPLERRHVDARYKEFTLVGMNSFVRVDDLEMVSHLSPESLVGYLSTQSASQRFLQRNPDTTIFTKLIEELSEVLETDYPGDKFHVTWPLVLLMGRNRIR